MALTNYSIPFGALTHAVQPWSATVTPSHSVHQLTSNTNNLLYAPADHQQSDDGAPPPSSPDFYKNNPYAPPQLHNRRKTANTYLPPIPPQGARGTTFNQYNQQQQQQQYSQLNIEQQQLVNTNNNNAAYEATNSASALHASSSFTRTYAEGSYNRFPAPATLDASPGQTKSPHQEQQQPQQQPQKHYYNSFSGSQTQTQTRASSSAVTSAYRTNGETQSRSTFGSKVETPASTYGPSDVISGSVGDGGDESDSGGGETDNGIGGTLSSEDTYPERPPGFTRVQAGQGSRTQVHAVLDYDVDEGEEDYYDHDNHGQEVNMDGSRKSHMPTVTPIQGPIFLKNGTVPVVPLFSYPTLNNGSFMQIPIWWTALSVALGLDVRGDIIKGVPCIKRFHQLFCPTAGNSYPIEKIERFIDDNKALMRRMYGDFEMNIDVGGPRQQTKKRKRRFIDEPDIFIPPGVFSAVLPEEEGAEHSEEAGESYFGKLRRSKRQQSVNRNSNKVGKNGPGNPGHTNGSSTSGRLDACESKIEIVTPYWASNSAGKIRAIVNTQHFEQAIHQEICSKTQTKRCERECGCEQKYKWHRLLAYDPDNDCKGIFMDWFLFPSCCVCRCNP